MSITYNNKSRHPMIQTNTRGVLATGWIEYTADWTQERLYAVSQTGMVKRSQWLKAGQPDFNHVTRRWEEVEVVPAAAIFCGNYYPDMF